MKRVRFAIALASILFITACHNAGSSTAQEIEDDEPAKTEEHGGHEKPAEHDGTATHQDAAKDTTMAHDTSAASDTVPHQH